MITFGNVYTECHDGKSQLHRYFINGKADIFQYGHPYYSKKLHVRDLIPPALFCFATLVKLIIIIIIMITIIINLIFIVQFNTNSILTALYIVIQYIQMQYVHI